MPHVMSVLLLPNSSANSVIVIDTVKKSKASQDHATKATKNCIHWSRLSRPSTLNGFSTCAIGGLSVVTRDLRYSPALIFSSEGGGVPETLGVRAGT
ncbi:unnamed protein product [Phytophthora fragariaefolia]|uniref:Unnamed protein product n=1 Tax=Phytophthora fragariaefolia TaxID=1490495 RepID=A0A9W6YEK3_9STRA|nr:unnamed protein product [Phytophthora fragariaefolia]